MGTIYHLSRGSEPLLVSVPHAGVELPEGLMQRLSPVGRGLPDTDWWVDRVWRDAMALGAGMLVARYSRYVIDLNRPPDDAPLYRREGTGLVPLSTFDGDDLYPEDDLPNSAEVSDRLNRFWTPFHDALAGELRRLRALHGHVILLDAHSIRSKVPRLFDGRLPDLNLGSHGGASAAPGLVRAAFEQLQEWKGCSRVLDGRFRGGYITRNYGHPSDGIHVLQMEMSQSVYMREDPPREIPARLEAAQGQARRFMQCLIDWNPADD
jgi:N-formylglutamate amidohydrolase